MSEIKLDLSTTQIAALKAQLHDEFSFIEVGGFALETEIQHGKRIIHLNDNEQLLMRHKDGRCIHLFEHTNYWQSLLDELKPLMEDVQTLTPQIDQLIDWLSKTIEIESKKGAK